MEQTRVLVKCTADDGILKIEKWEDGHDHWIVFISYYIADFYARQHNDFNRWVERFKMIWRILRCKEYQLFEVLIDREEELEDFKNQMRKFLEE